MRGLAPDALQQGDLALQGRQDRTFVDARGLPRPIAGDLVLLGAADDGLDDRRLGGRGRGEGLHLDQGLVDDEVRRDHAVGDVLAGDGGLLVHQASETLHPRQVGVGVRLGLDRVLGVQEVRHRLIGAGQLAQHIGRAGAAAAIAELPIALVLDGQHELHGVVVDGVHALEGLAVDGAQGVQLLAGPHLGGLDGGERAVAQLALGPGQLADIQAQAGGHLGRQPQLLGHDHVEQGVQASDLARPRLGQGRRPSDRGEARGGGGKQHVTAIEQGFSSRNPDRRRKLFGSPPETAKLIPTQRAASSVPQASVTKSSFSITHWPVTFFQVAR